MSEIITTTECGANDQFTPEFKRLKAKNPPPDLSGVIDLTTLNLSQHGISSHVEKGILQYPVKSCDLRPITGVRPWKEWKCYQFTEYPGLIVIQNPFIDGYQRYWIYRCLQDFPSDRENVTNLSSLGDGSRELWGEFVRKRSSAFDKHDPLRKLRWTTLGYHYNWTTKEYSEDQKAPFPADVNCLSQYIGACMGFAPYQAEAAIVNYYHLDSTLAGHTDHSELDHSAPLFSISFGQTAIFLLGGHTKCVRPMSVFLRSGDICVMSGECRLAYHAVPKILAPSADKPVPSCFNLTQVCNRAAHDVATRRHNSSCFCENSGEVETCELRSSCEHNSVIFHNSNDTSSSASTDPCDARISLEHQHSQKDHHTITAGEVMIKSEPALLNCDSLTVKEYDTYISSYNSNIDQVNNRIEHVVGTLDFAPYEVYLKSSRINLNIRQVLPPGCDQLDSRLESDRGDNSSDCCMGDNLQEDNEKVLDNSKVSVEFDAEKILVLPKHDGSEIELSDVTVMKKIRTDL